MKISEIESSAIPPPEVTVSTFLGQPVTKPGDVRDLINQNLKIQATTDAEAVQQAVDMLKDRPKSRFIQQIFNDLEMMATRWRLPIGGYYRAVLRHRTESQRQQGRSITEKQDQTGPSA